MSFTNINDPAGVKALLDKLRLSQAWQEAVTEPPPPSRPDVQQPSSSSSSNPSSTATATASPSTSVASLLSQLQSSPSFSWPPRPTDHAVNSIPTNPTPIATNNRLGDARSSHGKVADIKHVTYQQSLPLLAQLSEDPKFVASITELKKKQDDLEAQLWKEREAIHRKYEDKVKASKTKAAMIGTGISKHEAEMLSDAYKKELRRFDLERVLPAWDSLIQKQQEGLAHLQVPTMFATEARTNRERQQRVMGALEGMVGSEEPEI